MQLAGLRLNILSSRGLGETELIRGYHWHMYVARRCQHAALKTHNERPCSSRPVGQGVFIGIFCALPILFTKATLLWQQGLKVPLTKKVF